ncbi:MAG: DNA topoisomerase IV subunit A, partial [Methermicoccaceae archaeon]
MKESLERNDVQAVEELKKIANELYDDMVRGDVPALSLPTRTKGNIEYNENSDVWVYGDLESIRSFKTLKGARSLLKMAYTMQFVIDNHLLQGRSSTLRELYYISE